MTSALNLEDQFSFYGQYHTNKVNVWIHVFCVPTILQTALILVHKFPQPALFTAALSSQYYAALPALQINATPAFLVTVAYATYFILLEPIAGFLYAPILLGMGHFSNVFYETNPDAMKIAGALFVAAWIFQFIGHGKFEGRAPALFDSLFQSLVLAVFFVFLEVLFMLGYRPELHKRLNNRIGKAVLQYRKEKAAKDKARKKA